jgi:hypothetical protein
MTDDSYEEGKKCWDKQLTKKEKWLIVFAALRVVLRVGMAVLSAGGSAALVMGIEAVVEGVETLLAGVAEETGHDVGETGNKGSAQFALKMYKTFAASAASARAMATSGSAGTGTSRIENPSTSWYDVVSAKMNSPDGTPVPLMQGECYPPTDDDADLLCGPGIGSCRYEGAPCCSKYGWCGSGEDYCSEGTRVDYGYCASYTALVPLPNMTTHNITVYQNMLTMMSAGVMPHCTTDSEDFFCPTGPQPDWVADRACDNGGGNGNWKCPPCSPMGPG